MFNRTAGAGSLYWLSTRDSSGAFLDGGKAYKLTIPQPVPGKLFWSVTAYDARPAAGATDRGKAACAVVSLRTRIVAIGRPYGPSPPAGQEARWIKTTPNKAGSPHPIYGPEQAATKLEAGRLSRRSAHPGGAAIGSDFGCGSELRLRCASKPRWRSAILPPRPRKSMRCGLRARARPTLPSQHTLASTIRLRTA